MSFSANHGSLQLRIALLGNPCVHLDWNEQEVSRLAQSGFNAVQLNIAWLSRPYDEALNLRDVVTVPGDPEEPRVAERRTELRRRCALARRFGLRTLFHFGSPFMWRNPYTGQIDRTFNEQNNYFNTADPWFDTLNPLVLTYESKLLQEFRCQFPDVDDILVYTYDQDAWQAKEFGNSKYSRGIPLHTRLPNYLQALHRIWTEGREDSAMLWWEPWELSAGQIYACLPRLPRSGFGLMLHSNIAEVQIVRPVDVWFRNMGWVCRELGLPIVGEGFFGAMTEEIEPFSIPCPRLMDEQFRTLTSVPSVVGIKEYYGVLPLAADLNLDMLRARLAHPTASTERLLTMITRRFGRQKARVRAMMELLAEAFRLYPWDASWFARETGRADIDHGWSGATVRGQLCETPSWNSSRRAHFMMTDDLQPHPFLLEDVQLRCTASAQRMDAALEICQGLLSRFPNDVDRLQFEQIRRDLDRFKRVTVSYALHLRETNVAQMLREDLQAGRPMMPSLLEEMGRLLEADVANQEGHGRVLEMSELFFRDPEAFIRTQLVLTEQTILEKGHHTLTTR